MGDVLDVVFHEGRLFLAGSGNRRLCLWRLLAIFQPHRWGMMKVRICDRGNPRLRWQSYFTTKCGGDWVEVRWKRYVGKSRDDVVWPEARALLESAQVSS